VCPGQFPDTIKVSKVEGTYLNDRPSHSGDSDLVEGRVTCRRAVIVINITLAPKFLRAALPRGYNNKPVAAPRWLTTPRYYLFVQNS